MNIERWALTLFKLTGLVPKSSKTIARSQIKCASCEICSYHLGLESPDLSPPFKDMYICDVCNRTYHWQCLHNTYVKLQARADARAYQLASFIFL